MKVKIQNKTPYQLSFEWEIQYSYYHKQGKKTWQKGQVPFNISCNSQFAYQNASVIFESIKKSVYEENEKIYILELGSGSGIFSLNFIEEFIKICQSKKKNFYKNLHYMISDYSEVTLKDISENKKLEKFKNEGLLDFYVLNALEPQKAKKLSGEEIELDENSIQAVIANYLHSNIPVAFLKKSGEKYFEKQSEIFYNTKEHFSNKEQLIKKILDRADSSEILKDLETQYSYEKIDLEKYILNEVERNIIKGLYKDTDNIEFTYPVNSLKILKESFQLLRENGIILISDKSFHNEEEYMKKVSLGVIHFNSISNNVNIPLFENFAKGFGYDALRTEFEEYYFHTIMICNNKKIPLTIKNSFKKHFIKSNFNNIAFEHYRLGRELLNTDLSKALEEFHKTLDFIPDDCWLLYTIGGCYLSLKNFEEAKKYFLAGQKNDSFEYYDYDLFIGMCNLNLGKKEEAKRHFDNSIEKFGKNEKISALIKMLGQ